MHHEHWPLDQIYSPTTKRHQPRPVAPPSHHTIGHVNQQLRYMSLPQRGQETAESDHSQTHLPKTTHRNPLPTTHLEQIHFQ